MCSLPGVDTATVELVWHEAWSPERLSDSARAKLRFLPDPATVRDPASYAAENWAAQPPHEEGPLMIGDALVFDGVAHPFNFEADNARGPAGQMFSNHLYAFHTVLTPEGQPLMSARSSCTSGASRRSARWSTRTPTPTCWSRCRCR